jgi:hypothetical protein
MNYNNLFQHELTKMIDTELSRIAENLCVGMAITDIAQYKHEVGRIQGLRTVLGMFEEVNTVLSER